MRSLSDIRSIFIDFFKHQGHEHVSSSPLVPRNDPTLLFTNAGMVQFKDLFTGVEKRAYNRAVTAQKCLRAGGKHNDLENVGYTARHHTFFEMLGNFSFGDYFKEQAIDFAWTLVTRDFALPKDRLLVTVYAEDEEAAGYWRKIAGLSDDRIIRIPTSDNFWSMGDTGPCGPCTEIFFDHGEGIPGGPPGSPDEDGDRFIEIWNLVFMQFEQLADGRRIKLPKPSVDTGMGLERIAAVLQGVHNNYDTDLFQHLIRVSTDLTGAADSKYRQSHNVIADHLRACSFLLADGVLPSNEGRGYVLRRIMRRAMRHAHLLGAKEPLMWRLVPALIQEMGGTYPELGRAEPLIVENLRLEEERFRQTLERGLKLLQDSTSSLKAGDVLSGETAFKLYDTYGFPIDLTQDVLKASQISVDVDGFNKAMAEQKTAARASWIGSGDTKNEQIWFDLQEKNGITEFLGYDTIQADGIVQALVKEDTLVDTLSVGDSGLLVVNQTPFYAESGGQMGDQGIIITADGAKGIIRDTIKKRDLHVHIIEVTSGTLSIGTAVSLKVDEIRRDRLRANHSATHLLHAALRKVLGSHVTQKGSLVAPDRLRFDFTHTKALTPEEWYAVETLVNQQIQKNSDVHTHLTTPEDAMAKGAMALFGERYGDEVRVLSMGNEEGAPFSIELCGGTHVHRTGDIGLLKITSETGISAGVRRIEALTGPDALQYLNTFEKTVGTLSAFLKTTPADLVGRIEALVSDKKTLERQVADLRKQLVLLGEGHTPSQEAGSFKQVGPWRLAIKTLVDVPAKDLKSLADELKVQVKSGIVLLTSNVDGKVALVVGVTDDLTSQVNAVELAKVGAEILGSKGGGGRPDLAQAGGSNPQAIPHAISAICEALQKKVA